MKLYDLSVAAILLVFLIGAVVGTVLEEDKDAVDLLPKEEQGE